VTGAAGTKPSPPAVFCQVAVSHIRLSPSRSYSVWLATPWSRADCHYFC